MNKEEKIRMMRMASHAISGPYEGTSVAWRIGGWVMFWICLIAILLFAAYATAEVSLGYGKQMDWLSSSCPQGKTHSIAEIEFQADEPKPWTFSFVGQYLQDDGTSGALHIRLGLKQVLWSRLVVRLFGGFGLHSGIQPEIGKSQVLGHFGAGVGLRIGHAAVVSYSITHMSDPLQRSDFGWNYQLISIGISLRR